ncbi:ABC-type transporter, integral membrane subunit [Gemmatirosa kalamazoonensis]|uniref:ABC-type transporter, integral membrane subunit n=1 Tax=Gemmatirosa kalamazoonensis TaxID=861299 RepID=W0RK87_9BACT|nr:ABC transporter permease [Gemmatirosa kalamazoonensis]AHG91176.1 ABC-type transporter, integral membrane subunit [Gemmatirosa kalamazoonensis]
MKGRRTALVVPAVMLGALALIVLLGPLLSRGDPLGIGDVLATRLMPPGTTDRLGAFHPFGTDRFGRDVLLRALVAGRLSLGVGVVGSVLAGALGTALGAWAGWRGGTIDLLVTAAADTLLSVPRLVLLLVIAALWGPGTLTTVVVLVATGWMGVARLVRAEVLGARRRDWVDAARAVGAPPGRILWRHVVPNAVGPAIVATTLGVGNAILLESGLSFLGLGIQPPAPSWGNMIAGGRDLIVTAPWIAVTPGLALVLTVLACTLLGDALRDRLAGETEI